MEGAREKHAQGLKMPGRKDVDVEPKACAAVQVRSLYREKPIELSLTL